MSKQESNSAGRKPDYSAYSVRDTRDGKGEAAKSISRIKYKLRSLLEKNFV